MNTPLFKTHFYSAYLYLKSNSDGVIGLAVAALLLLVIASFFRLRKKRTLQPKPTKPVQKNYLYSGLSAIMAFLMWGGWAYYVNASIDTSKGISSGLTQGTASFTITLIMVHLVGWFINRLPLHFIFAPVAALLTVGITGCGLVTVHLLAGTPDILATISPALAVGLLFCWFTAAKLQKVKVALIKQHIRSP